MGSIPGDIGLVHRLYGTLQAAIGTKAPLVRARVARTEGEFERFLG